MTEMQPQRRTAGAVRRSTPDLPAPGCGIGLRREHYELVLRDRPSVPWFEVVTENFMGDGGRPRHLLESVRSDYPIGLHGVSLSIGSDEPVNRPYVRRLKELVDRIDPIFVSDHLCWTSLGGHNSHDLLPLPFTAEAVHTAATTIRQVQDVLGRRLMVENISTYLRFSHSGMTEWEFVRAVLEEADCDLLLDINNVYVNARNHGFDPRIYIEHLPADRVRQFHLAGHEDHGDFVIDTHDHPVADPVWELFRFAVRRFGPVATLIERDANIPEFEVIQNEARQAQDILEDREERDARRIA